MRIRIDQASAQRERKMLELQGQSVVTANSDLYEKMKKQISTAVGGEWPEDRLRVGLGEIVYPHGRIHRAKEYYARLKRAVVNANEASASIDSLIKNLSAMEWFQYRQLSLLYDSASGEIDAAINDQLFEQHEHENIPATESPGMTAVDVTPSLMLVKFKRDSVRLSVLSEALQKIISLPHGPGKAQRYFIATMKFMALWSELTKRPIAYPRSYKTEANDRKGKPVRDTSQPDLFFVWQGLRMINDKVSLAIAETSMKNVLNHVKSISTREKSEMRRSSADISLVRKGSKPRKQR